MPSPSPTPTSQARPSARPRRPGRPAAPLGLGVLALLAILAAIVGMAAGSSPIPVADVVRAVFGTGTTEVLQIVRAVRAPTVALAAVVGALLGASGAAMQGLLRNPLADPYLLGISGGAALGAAAVVATGSHGAWVPPAAFLGAMAAVAVIHAVASAMPGGLDGPGATTTLLLTGVVFNALAGAVILIVHALLVPERSQEILLWMMGTLAPGRAAGGGFVVAVALGGAGLAVLTALGRRLDVLTLGDTQAAALGVDPVRTRTLVFVAGAVAVGSAVAFSGLVGFVGLLVPHMVRLALGPGHRTLIPGSALAGAAFLVLADAGARAAFPIAMTALPVGAVTALVGAPLFFVLLRRGLRTGEVQ